MACELFGSLLNDGLLVDWAWSGHFDDAVGGRNGNRDVRKRRTPTIYPLQSVQH